MGSLLLKFAIHGISIYKVHYPLGFTSHGIHCPWDSLVMDFLVMGFTGHVGELQGFSDSDIS